MARRCNGLHVEILNVDENLFLEHLPLPGFDLFDHQIRRCRQLVPAVDGRNSQVTQHSRLPIVVLPHDEQRCFDFDEPADEEGIGPGVFGGDEQFVLRNRWRKVEVLLGILEVLLVVLIHQQVVQEPVDFFLLRHLAEDEHGLAHEVQPHLAVHDQLQGPHQAVNEILFDGLVDFHWSRCAGKIPNFFIDDRSIIFLVDSEQNEGIFQQLSFFKSFD